MRFIDVKADVPVLLLTYIENHCFIARWLASGISDPPLCGRPHSQLPHEPEYTVKMVLHPSDCNPGRHGRAVTAERCVCIPTWNVGTIRGRGARPTALRWASLSNWPDVVVSGQAKCET
jgi:hypothetical protein